MSMKIMPLKNSNRKAQIDFPIIGLIVVAVALLISAPFILKVFHTINTNMGDNLGNMTNGEGVIAKQNVNYVFNTASGLLDQLAIVLFVIACVVMLIGAFFVDAHPIFVVLYIIVAFFTILFTPHMISVVDTIYADAQLTTEVAQLTYLTFLKDNFIGIILGFIVLTGFIIYGKIFLFGSQNSGVSTR